MGGGDRVGDPAGCSYARRRGGVNGDGRRGVRERSCVVGAVRVRARTCSRNDAPARRAKDSCKVGGGRKGRKSSGMVGDSGGRGGKGGSCCVA